MDIGRIRTLIEKEWAEVFKNRLVLFTVAFLPLVFTALPLGVLYATRNAGGSGDLADMPPQFLQLCGDLSGSDCLQMFITQQFLLMFMMMPLIIPVSIAAYSIVGEKTTRSLEPLLATPITTLELLAGKGLAAAVPAVLATWLAFGLFALGAPLVGGGPAVVRLLTSPVWLLAVFVAGPLMSVMSVSFAIMVSSRANDPRVAEQMAAVIIVPLLATLFAQLAGVIVLNLGFMLAAIAVLVIVDALLLPLGARLFEREAILTRWK